MFSMFADVNDTLQWMGSLEREVERAFNRRSRPAIETRDFALHDDGDALRVVADLPGVQEDEVKLLLENDVLSLEAVRTQTPPEGYSLVRSERRALQFSRAIELPCPVRGDAVTATLQHGVLTVRLPKAPEAQPRKIAIGKSPTPTLS